jgi:predicted phosphodiesterase
MAVPLPPKLAQEAVTALALHKGNKSAAAAALGLDRCTYCHRLGIGRAAGMKPGKVAGKKSTNKDHVFAAAKPPDARALNRTLDDLQAQVVRMTQARKWKAAKVTKRTGKDDTIRVFMPDTHGSYSDPVAVSLFLEDMKRLQPDYITNLGDLVDCGGFLAAHHVIGYQAQMEYSYEQDISTCNGILDKLQEYCPKTSIEMIEGNHEDRVERWCIQQALGNGRDSKFMQQAFAPQYLLNLKGRGIPYYRRSENYDGLSIPGAVKRGKIIVVHDPGFSDPRRTLSRFGAPVVHGHDHQSHANVTSTVGQGDIGVWSFGCLAKRQQLYAHSRPTGHVHGYGIALQSRSGHFLMLSVPIIEGTSYLGKLFR